MDINGCTPKWLVYKGKSERPIKMDDEQGYPHDLGNLHLSFANHDLRKAYAWYFAKVAYTSLRNPRFCLRKQVI